MKTQKTIKLILTAFILLLGLTGCAEKSDRELLQLYDKINVSTAGITLDGLQFGMTQDEVMQAEGLKDSDIEIKELEDINATVIKVKDPVFYEEVSPYGTLKTFSFVEGKLTNVAFNTMYSDVSADEGYKASLSVYNKVKQALDIDSKKIQYSEYGDFNSLKNIGGTYTIQVVFENEMLTLNMNNQDMTEADYTDMDEMFNMSINIRQK